MKFLAALAFASAVSAVQTKTIQETNAVKVDSSIGDELAQVDALYNPYYGSRYDTQAQIDNVMAN